MRRSFSSCANRTIHAPTELADARGCTGGGCGSGHTLFVTRAGELLSAGANACGQLGHGRVGGESTGPFRLVQHCVSHSAQLLDPLS